MFSLIITVISIALALVLVMAVLYYGSEAFGKHSDKVVAETLVNQSVQIAAAQQIAKSQGLTLPSGATIVLPVNLLSSMPVPPKDAYASATPDASDWKFYVPGSAGHFGLQTKLSKRACMAVNKSQGMVGIPAVWDGTTAIQCFGLESTDGYTYLYQPSGQTPEQTKAALDQSLGEVTPTNPDAMPGYPRLCPDESTITSGVCPTGTAPDTSKKGFWTLSAVVDTTGAPSIISEGYSDTCPADAIDPTTAAVQPVASGVGEPFNVDGLVELGWSLPPDYASPSGAPMTRKWCLPAVETDVVNTGNISGDYQDGGILNPVMTVIPTNTAVDPNDYSGAKVAAVVVTANAVKWTLLATGFEVDAKNKTTDANPWMIGRKVALAKSGTASRSYFLASPPATVDGITYQYKSGTITFTPQPPKAAAKVCDKALNVTTLGLGGAIVDLYGDDGFSVMRKADGSVWATGYNANGQIGVCHEDNVLRWTRVLLNATDVYMSPWENHIYTVKNGGTLWMSGRPFGGEAGPGYEENFENDGFIQLATSNVVRGGGGSQYSAHLKADGTIWFTGWNGYGEAGNNLGKGSINQFVQVTAGAASITPVYGGIYFLKADHSLWASGSTYYSRLGFVDDVYGTTGTPRKLADNVAKVDGGFTMTVYLTNDGRAFAAGSDSWQVGQFGMGNGTFDLPAFTQLLPGAGTIVDVVVLNSTVKLLDSSGRLWAAGSNDSGNFGDGTRTNSLVFKVIATNVAKFTAGGIVLDKSGVLWGVGDNTSGQYGDGTLDGSDSTYKRILY